MDGTHFTVYRLDTGEVVSVQAMAFAPEHRQLYLDAALVPWGGDAHGILEAYADPARHYVAVLGGVPRVEDRPDLVVSLDTAEITADGVDAATLTGLPDPCTVVIDADDPTVETTVTEVGGGGFVVTASDPGTYAVEVRRFPFMPFRVEITAVPP